MKDTTERNGGGFVGCDGSWFTRDGRRFFPLGVNYLPSYRCGDHFSDWREEHILADLDHIRSSGLDCVRVAVFWKSFEPRRGEFSEGFRDAFTRFVAACKERGILVMPVFLIGTWTGMYDAPYWMAPGMYQGEMLECEAAHVAEFVRPFAEETAILCWDLSDEPWYLEAIPPAPPRRADGVAASRKDIATNWVARLCRAIRGVDGNHLITLGSDPHPVRNDTGFALEEMAEHLDVMAYCIYPWPSHGAELDLISYGAFQTRFFATGGKPAFLHEGPGVSSSGAGEQVVADRFRAWMYSSLANGNIGVLPWCYTDYQEERHREWPLDDKPQEPNFGLFHSDRKPKPRVEELFRFARDVRGLPLDDLALEKPRAVMVYPCDYYENAGQLHARLWRHFTVVKGANINADLVREDRLPADASLVIVPGFPLRLSTWERLRAFVRAGGRLLLVMDEFFCLSPSFPGLFGVEVEGLRPGGVDAGFDAAWGRLPAGARLAFGGAAQRLWVKPTSAVVIARFADGWPFLLENRLGAGTAYLATFPFPLGLDLGEPRCGAVQAALDVMRELRDRSGCTPTVDPDRHWVETAVFHAARGGEDWAVVVNWDRAACTTGVRIHGGYRLATDGAAAVELDAEGRGTLRLGPNGAVVLQLRR
jgi:hypothetical protein